MESKSWILQKWDALRCVDVGDAFVDVLRKTVATIMFPIAPFPLFYAAYYGRIGWENPENLPETFGMRFQSISNVYFVLTMGLPFVVLRFTRHISTTQVDVVIFSILINVLITLLNFPQYPNATVTILVALLAILAQARFMIVQCLICAVLCLISNYNLSYLLEKDATLALLPGYRVGPPLEVMLNYVGILFIQAVVIAGIFLQGREQVRHVAAATAAVDLAHRIVGLLRRYDTEGVKGVLSSEEVRAVDPALVASLAAMNANLETYKPFLPNYVLQDDEDQDNAAAQLLDEGSLSKSVGDGNSRHSESALGGAAGRDDDCSSMSSRTSHGSSPSPLRRTPAVPSAVLSATRSQDAVYEGRISFALVECPALCSGATTATLLRHAATFASALHAAADETKGSVHALVGDVAQLTWNATHRVLQPELKVARFLVRLQTAVAGDSGVGAGIAAAAFSGRASCYSVTTASRQHAALVSASWLAGLDRAFRLARQRRAVLVDEQTDAVACHHLEAVAVEAVAWRAVRGGGVEDEPAQLVLAGLAGLPAPAELGAFDEQRVLYDLLHEHADENDDWLQLVSKCASSPTSAVTQAVRALVAAGGSATEAAALATGVLRSLEEACAATSLSASAGRLEARPMITRLDALARAVSLGRR